MSAKTALAKLQLAGRDGYCVVSLAVVVVLFAIVFLILCQNPLLIAPEVALNLEGAKLIASGRIPYADFFCLASPLMLYGSLPPLYLATSLKVDPGLVMNLLVWSFSLLSVGACAGILLPRRHHREWHCFPPFVVALALANVLMLFQIGQREHLFMLAFMPYFLIRWLRWHGHTVNAVEAIISGMFAGIGLCLSDLFFVVAASLEGFWLISTMKLRPLVSAEVLSCIGVVLVASSVFMLLPEAARDGYLSRVCPVLALCHDTHQWSMYGVTSVPNRRDVFYAAIVAMLFMLPLRRHSTLALPLVVMFWSGFWLYCTQPLGFTLYAIPMIFATTLLWGVNAGIATAIVHQLKFFKRRPLTWTAASPYITCACAVIVLLLAGAYLKDQANKIVEAMPTITDDSPGERPEVADCPSWIAAYSAKDDQILFLTDNILPGHPLMLQTERRPGGYLLETGFLFALDRAHNDFPQNKLINQLTDFMWSRIKQDIVSQRSKMVFVQSETIYNLLKKYKLLDTLNAYYEYKGGARLKRREENTEPLEYSGFKYEMKVYLPRVKHQ